MKGRMKMPKLKCSVNQCAHYNDGMCTKNYIDVDEIVNISSEEETDQDTEMFMRNLFDKLEYEIIASEKIDSKTVNVMTSITAVDMKPVLSEFLLSALQYAFSTAFSDPEPTEEETEKKMEELFVTSVSKPDIARVTNVVMIKVVKTDDGWRIDADDALVNALLGNMKAATEELEKSFN